MEKIDVAHVAKLARLKLTDQESVAIGKKFGEILGYIGLLAEVDLEGEGQDRDETQLVNYRPDGAVASLVKLEDFSELIENRHFKVPSIIE
ncbi:MAG: hypothetical protein A2508_04170 [Candidatus Lambdaproteobacteria bacterium RIFOXYD12_FULL_49_8]|uniref:Aspartyl/glutamyl-tRNA(Asn/Gln) amidotransferase subunit C n=1 Tax=Candidatus Lambdaproteobacteria bacterium RIFOXYD2_FULL_50_16 TaxID=1817772 RepID=A0A1F6G9S7_9PROT|nr:MAG: hypothetical protein A2527_12990 [Candidatus Lambdaproteobacteria bacterium RIFOXYD2_FULL_50_16]OGG98177.1 MAG: hypothetical protein A2508_04170 [Candidatus Lambdaproteobacteria bacterium RIFOXYD12_FULL_49_8]